MSTTGMLTVQGQRITGNSVRTQNVMACSAISNVIKSSFGPIGLDKMLVDDIGDVTVTNDGATILKLLEVEHPAAKVLVDLADLQDQEVGDGTTTVVLMAAELLKNADELVSSKIHPTSIISGYRLACKEACKFIQDCMSIDTDSIGQECVLNAVKTCLSSKLIGSESDFFAGLVLDACNTVKFAKAEDPKSFIYPIKNIRILKAQGKSTRESINVHGYALNCSLANQAMNKQLKNAKIACLDFSLQKVKMKLGVQVLINEPAELEAIRKRECDIAKERMQKIIAAGANVILTTGGIDEMCAKYLVEAGAMGVRRVRKMDLKKIAKASGATMISTMANMEGDETFETASLGEAEEIVVERISDDEVILIKGMKHHNASSIIVRGPNEYFLDEVERSLIDALNVVKRVMESKKVVPGGGAVEAALSIYLENLATSISSREQLAIAEFARAMLVIPKTLAVNAAQDATDLIAKLRAYHNTSQTKPENNNYKWYGLDLSEGTVRDSVAAGVLEPAMSKIKSLKFATEAAITILRIDDLIKLDKEKSDPSGGCYGDDE
ncbi:T-complex protein 1 subunit alpha-like [Panonychus citri]|uniref:T-complex protein 1 subunit alpha-like n=1 Tax=Panonychus citri TaxID=50023 RepID=UPI002307CD75|nr:T-complex protein 1 subunit alpha-like [Panonychus citri]